ncbi:MAG: short-chain dehydrogenase [Gemmatimonadetes bacterium]|nr:short-chain dehydrogenase [Gemmatimonadota bacterium]HCK08952.1 short-chain dehydrogenase [Candidatus Latescibacterota bacterium]
MNGKIALVTGGSRGIGKAIAHRLARKGCDTLLVAASETNLKAAAEEVRAAGRRVKTCATDLRDRAGCEKAAQALDQSFGCLDILINCAGATKGGLFLEQSDDVWQDGFALKFFGAVRMSRLLWPKLKERQGTVVNIIGGFSRTPDPDFMIGGAVNAAFANFSKALAGLGLRDDVNVNAIHPGLTMTERLEELFENRARIDGTSVEESKQKGIIEQGIRRLGTPEDVAELACFLCSQEARHIQGTAIAVDGGSTSCVY